MNRPTHATPGGHAYLELQRRARLEGVGTQELLVWYVHERFLYRVSRSSFRDHLILKGGMLLVAYEARRATQDTGETLPAAPSRPPLLCDLRVAGHGFKERSDRYRPELGNPSDRPDQRAIVDNEVGKGSDADPTRRCRVLTP